MSIPSNSMEKCNYFIKNQSERSSSSINRCNFFHSQAFFLDLVHFFLFGSIFFSFALCCADFFLIFLWFFVIFSIFFQFFCDFFNFFQFFSIFFIFLGYFSIFFRFFLSALPFFAILDAWLALEMASPQWISFDPFLFFASSIHLGPLPLFFNCQPRLFHSRPQKMSIFCFPSHFFGLAPLSNGPQIGTPFWTPIGPHLTPRGTPPGTPPGDPPRAGPRILHFLVKNPVSRRAKRAIFKIEAVWLRGPNYVWILRGKIEAGSL